ncbi:MAG: carboxymuconolactone decarboxylase family protein [Planctomycetota bacterium]
MNTYTPQPLESLFEGRDTVIARDLKLNLQKSLFEGALPPEEGHFALLALATSVGHQGLATYAREALHQAGVTPELIREAAESAALTGMLNLYYRFRHFIEHSQGSEGAARYTRVGLRMNAMMKPQMGHQRFEMLAFAVSVVNGCEMCVNGHEKKLLDLGVEPDAIHDLARLASLVKATKDLEVAQGAP